MGGINPYIETPNTEKATRKFKIRFMPEGREIEIDPSRMPSAGTGLPGSLLDIALGSGIEIDHACGGVCACSTCHVVVREGLSTCNPATEEEEDQLEKAPGLTSMSRLACQCVPNGGETVVVEIPGWNRNLVREGH